MKNSKSDTNTRIHSNDTNRNNFHSSHSGVIRILESLGGFTLLEMVISIGIFSVIIISAIGIMLGVSKAQIKANNLQAILDNTRFSLELITKEMRTGNTYTLTTYCNPGSEISFRTSDAPPSPPLNRIYYLYGPTKTIMRVTGEDTLNFSAGDCSGATGKAQPFTSNEISVESLNFTARGVAVGPDDGQPWIGINMSVKSKDAKYELNSTMDLQTSVVQRYRDIRK